MSKGFHYVAQVRVVTGSRKPHFMPHKSLGLILRTCTYQNLENSWKYFSEIGVRSMEKIWKFNCPT